MTASWGDRRLLCRAKSLPPAAEGEGAGGVSDALLFEGDQVEHLERLAEVGSERLNGSRLLWVDSTPVLTATRLQSRNSSRSIRIPRPASQIQMSERASTTTAATSTSRPTLRARTRRVNCTPWSAWWAELGRHCADQPIAVLEDFASRVSGSGDTGSLDGPSFVAALLEWVLGSYTAAFERMEQRLEEFDVDAMRGEGGDEDIDTLVEMRRQVGKLRRALAAHRGALVALTHPELEALGDSASGERFQSLFSRYESTLQEARDVREAIVGSFDVPIARRGHHTNQIMKVLTLTSVILLPGALLAGIMEMNLQGRPLQLHLALLGRPSSHRRHSSRDLRRGEAARLDLSHGTRRSETGAGW